MVVLIRVLCCACLLILKPADGLASSKPLPGSATNISVEYDVLDMLQVYDIFIESRISIKKSLLRDSSVKLSLSQAVSTGCSRRGIPGKKKKGSKRRGACRFPGTDFLVAQNRVIQEMDRYPTLKHALKLLIARTKTTSLPRFLSLKFFTSFQLWTPNSRLRSLPRAPLFEQSELLVGIKVSIASNSLT
jgi:hypothetical protein